MLALSRALRQLLLDLKSQKLRSALTLVGVAWGTAALCLLLAFGGGLRIKIRKDLTRAGENAVYGFTWRTLKAWQGLQKGRPIFLTHEDLEAVRAQAVNLKLLSPRQNTSLIARLGSKTRDVDVSGVSEDMFAIRKLRPLPGGRTLNVRDLEDRRRVAFVGYRLARQFLNDANPVGRALTLGGADFTVVGTLDPEDRNPLEESRDSDRVYIPVTTFRALTGQLQFTRFAFTPRDAALNKVTVESVKSVLSRRLKFDPTDTGALEFDDFTDFVRSANAFMTAVALLLGTAGVMTLIAGGVGVSNIMTVTVEERTREIGIQMALGARPRFILATFLIETLFITALGGSAGFLLTYGILEVFPQFHVEEYVGTPALSPELFGTVLCILGVVGAAAGYGPARKAAAMDPVVAMRH